jgi:two-component system NtrC family sensor kinase
MIVAVGMRPLVKPQLATAVLQQVSVRASGELERMQGESTLRKLTSAVAQSPVSILICDTSGCIEFVNPKFTQVTGYEKNEVLGLNPRFLKTGHTPPEEYRRLWSTISGGNVWEGEFQNRKKSGELFWEHATISPIRNSEGVITNYLAIKEDITGTKKLEEQLRQAQKMEAIGQLAGGVAHDFNNILQVIMTFATLMKMDNHLQAQDKDHVEQILASAHRAAHLTSDLLTFSRKKAMQPKPCDLNDIVLNFRKFLTRIIGEDITLKTTCWEAPLDVCADSGQLEQILINLATNARDAMPLGGEFTVTTEPAELDTAFVQEHGFGKPGRYAIMTVSDSGSGMDKEMLEKIFEPFFTTKGVGKGTGLGLAIVYGIVKQHGGHIAVSSEPGRGTTFRIYLPAIDSTEKALDELSPVGDEFTGSETILVVEDEEAVRQVASSVLQRFGYHVLTACDGKEGVEQFTAHRDEIKLVLMDVIMPTMNGREAVDRIREIRPDCRVLYTSGYTADIIQERSKLGSGEEIVQKPVPPLELLRKVRTMLDKV